MNETTALWEKAGVKVARNETLWDSTLPVGTLNDKIEQLLRPNTHIYYTVLGGTICIRGALPIPLMPLRSGSLRRQRESKVLCVLGTGNLCTEIKLPLTKQYESGMILRNYSSRVTEGMAP